MREEVRENVVTKRQRGVEGLMGCQGGCYHESRGVIVPVEGPLQIVRNSPRADILMPTGSLTD